jgi:glucan phosphoethanolaminetransferase (alkaline phosphatase superfamily)
MYNRAKAELLRVMNAKGEKQNIAITSEKNKIQVRIANVKNASDEHSIPVTFKGTLDENGEECSLKGRFTYGFYYTGLLIFAAILVLVRFLLSVYQKQTENIILCIIVAVILAIVTVIVNVKAKKSKEVIEKFLSNLNVK